MGKNKDKMTFWEKAKVTATFLLVVLLGLVANGYVTISPADRPLPAAMASAAILIKEEPPRLPAAAPEGMPATVRLIPDGLGNYRSAALTEADLQAALATGKIKYVLRLNGDTPNDRGPISCARESSLVAKAGAEYVTTRASNVNRFDAHAGYREGRGYVKAFERATLYLRRGGVLIHCRHGFDRTGAIVGAWLGANGHSFEAVIDHNNWQGYAERGAAYWPYLETVRGQVEISK